MEHDRGKLFESAVQTGFKIFVMSQNNLHFSTKYRKGCGFLPAN